MSEPLLTRYLQPLLAGRRADCFEIIQQAARDGHAAEALLCDVLWPAMSQVDRLYRADRINAATESMAARINRTVADQLQPFLNRAPRNGRRIVVTSGPNEREELGAQIIADLFQSEGWDVFLIGCAVPHDEVLALIGQVRPDTLMIFGAEPQYTPDVRALIDRIREIGVCPTMNIVVSGGVFNRADGLWLEVGADAFAPTAREALATVSALPPRKAGPPRRGIVKKRNRRRKETPCATPQPELVAAG